MSQGRDKVPVNVAAKIIEKSQRTVRRWVQEGRIDFERPSPRKTVIPRSELEALRQED
ncbi:MAG: helix-turn-helix domain-containing protein [Deltaproteobacteria bacterium]|nr:MAG: helix-turn-helix domain-containing protein [Deltaproteobacteria bacterium]